MLLYFNLSFCRSWLPKSGAENAPKSKRDKPELQRLRLKPNEL
jgi:hypothetical protein